jgi:phosphoadenosine phosphosulfate reductase
MKIQSSLDKKQLCDSLLEKKIEFSKEVLSQAVREFGIEHLGIAITGGKDSTLSLWLLRESCRELNLSIPKCMFIDEGDVFEEILEFVEDLERSWRLNSFWMKNEDVINKTRYIGEEIYVANLNNMNRNELNDIDFKGESFPFEPESFVGNHLMKTVPMKMFIRESGIKALITSIRWDEQEARINEDFVSPRENPVHTRIHPILHFREKDVWDAIHRYNIPFCKLYREGYRSLGAKSTTGKVADLPAWEQDLSR